MRYQLEDAMVKFIEGDYDVLVVDRMLPKRDGLSLIGALRDKGDRTPDQTAQDELQCGYESRAATANIRSGIEAGYMQAYLRMRCMMANGYRRRPNPPSSLAVLVEWQDAHSALRFDSSYFRPGAARSGTMWSTSVASLIRFRAWQCTQSGCRLR